MNEPRLKVDFNELVEHNLVLLSQDDIKIDSLGNKILLKEGLKVKIYEEDLDQNDKPDYLIAEGIVEKNPEYLNQNSWTSACKWNCRIGPNGIRNISEIKNGR